MVSLRKYGYGPPLRSGETISSLIVCGRRKDCPAAALFVF